MDELHFYDNIIFNALEGSLSEKEQKDFLELLEKEPELKKRYEQLSRMWYYGKYSGKWSHVNEAAAWDNIKARRSKKLHRRWLGWSVAASMALFLGVSALLLMDGRYDDAAQESVGLADNKTEAYLILSSGEKVRLGNAQGQIMQEEGIVIQGDSAKLIYEKESLNAAEKYNELVVPKEGEYQLRLSDGTVVYLNADSKLKYPLSFGKDCRLVELEGEGYFEVAHDAERPFVVRTKELDVNVLGTGFNILSYDEDEKVEVTLVHGKVAVNKANNEIVLRPDEQLVFDRHDKEMSVKKVNAQMIAAWTQGILVFDAMPLSELAVKLARWFNVDFFFTSEKLKQLKFTGTFKKDSDIEYILSLIEATTDIHLRLKGNTIVVEK